MKSPHARSKITRSSGGIKVEIHVRVEPKLAAALGDALFPEIKEAPEQYVNATLRKKRDHLVIVLSGRKISHVRASANSLLRLIIAAMYSVMSVTKHSSPYKR